MKPIFVIEDDKKIGRVVKAYLEGAGYRVVHFKTGKEAIEHALKETPLLVILDLMLPDISGEEVFQELKDTGDYPIVMLTAKSSEEERVAGFALGADDYVVKPFSPRELVFRVKAILKRTEPDLSEVKPMSFNKGLLIIDGQNYRVKWKDNIINLTPKEFKILFTLASSPGKIFTREEIVEKAMGYQFEGYERSIDAHIKNIRQKLGEDPRNPNLILTIYGVGYKFIGKRDD